MLMPLIPPAHSGWREGALTNHAPPAGGLLVAMGLRSITDAVPWFSVVMGVGLIVVGLAMVAGHQVRLQVRRPSLNQASPGGGHLVGFVGGAYALAQLGCGMGSLLALIGTGIASESTLGTMGVSAPSPSGPPRCW